MKYAKGECIVKHNSQVYDGDKYLFTVSLDYDHEQIEVQESGESWLNMRRRTEHLRNEAKINQHKSAVLFSKAPEMYEALKTIRDAFWSEGEKPKEQVKDLKSIAESLLKEIEPNEGN